jgi:hypothetical protein
MPTIKQLSRIFSDDSSLNRLQDQLASALNPILRNVQGDLSGPLESPLVVGLQGVGVSQVQPTTGQSLVYNGTQWAPGSASAAGVTAVTATAPVVSSGGTTPNISMAKATASADGWLSSVDWSTFNSKVGSVTATSPLASTGGSTPDISLAGVVSASHGGTGLSSPGTAGNVLTSTGSGWTSSAVSASPTGPAGGVLGYPSSTYPNPNGLAANVFGAPSVAYIPIKVAVDPFGALKETWFRLDDTSDGYGNSLALRAGDAPTGYFGISIRGGNVGLIAGRGAPNYSGGEGGVTYLEGGLATGGWAGGAVNIYGGTGGSSAGTGGAVNITGGAAGSGGVAGNVNIGASSTTSIKIGTATTPPTLYWQGQQVDITTVLPTTDQLLGYNGTKWVPVSHTVLPATFISLTDSTVTTAISSGSATIATFDTVEDNNGITLVSGSQIKVPVAGLYEFSISPQLELTSGTANTITIWLLKNGTNVAKSASQIELGSNHQKSFPYISLMINLAANDYVQWGLEASGTNGQLASFAAASSYPAIPALIATGKLLGT